jgi:hypothetical protein
MNDKLQARDQAELGFLMQHLKELDLSSELISPSDELPIGALVVPLLQDRKGRDRYLTFSFVPLSEDDVQHIRLLQIHTVVPALWKPGTTQDVERLLHAANGRTAIGHFGIDESREISFRYVYCAPGSTLLPKDAVLEVIDLFALMLDTFAETIEDVASGEKTLQEALRMMQ